MPVGLFCVFLRLESRGSRHKVALYLGYLRIKFDIKLKRNRFEFQADLLIIVHATVRIIQGRPKVRTPNFG